MITHRLALLFSFVSLLMLAGCGRHVISPRELANEKPAFDATQKSGDLILKAKLLSREDIGRIFEENAHRYTLFGSSKHLFKNHYSVVLLTIDNKGAAEHTVDVTNSDLPAQSEILPNFSYKENTYFTPGYGLSTTYWFSSDNGLSEKDAQTLKSFALFSDHGRSKVVVPPYGKQVKLLFLNTKVGNARYKVKMTIESNALWSTQRVILNI